MKMNDFVVKASLEDVAHSSGYAKAQSGSNFGATSSKTFTDRMSIDRRNTKIRAYRESKIAQMRASNVRDISKSAQTSLDKIRSRQKSRNIDLESPRADFVDRLSKRGLQSVRSELPVRSFSEIKQSGLAGRYVKANSPSSQTSSAQIRPDFYR
ncbi:MAG: hypothetical protein Q4A23_00800 [bacterium]|nr:hypothetical protein [bacterium]